MDSKSTMRRHWTGHMVWDGRDISAHHNWSFQLGRDDLSDIEYAVKNARKSGKAMEDLSPDDFPFGDFGQKILTLRDEVLTGRGFVLIRGLSNSSWASSSWPNSSRGCDEDLLLAYWGIGKWFGDPVPQNANAHLLGHVIDQRQAPSEETRSYQTNQAQPFHSDSCDIVGLLCLRQAKSGGRSSIASSPAIHNALLHNDPDALDQLYGTYQCDRYGEIPQDKLPYYAVRIFNEINGQFVCCGMDPDIRSAQRLNEVTPLSRQQQHALNSFQAAARKLALSMTLQRGDIQLINNHVIVHSREQFEDHREANLRRYLVRLWLSSPVGRALPSFMAERWGNIEVGTIRGGIRVPGATPVVPLDPDNYFN